MSTIYSVCNNVVVPKIINNGSPIELNIADVDSFVSGTGKTNSFNLLKYPYDCDTIIVNITDTNNLDQYLMYINKTNNKKINLVYKLSDLNGPYMRVRQNQESWANYIYIKYIMIDTADTPRQNTISGINKYKAVIRIFSSVANKKLFVLPG